MGLKYKECRECLTEYPNTLKYFAPYYAPSYSPSGKKGPSTGVNCKECEERVIREGRELLKELEERQAKRKLQKANNERRFKLMAK